MGEISLLSSTKSQYLSKDRDVAMPDVTSIAPTMSSVGRCALAHAPAHARSAIARTTSAHVRDVRNSLLLFVAFDREREQIG